jgi:MerR family transcriptional regulator, light-induced transcriptional regulator
MQDGHANGFRRHEAREAGGVAFFAAEVVARLVAGEVTATGPLREDLIVRFMQSVVHMDMTDFDALKADLRRARISNATFSDRYIPEIARRLGTAWEDDELSFAAVTMGASRLQAILRQIGSDWVADEGKGASSSGATVLLIVPPGEQHTLGVFVLIGQMRRRGISVCLRIGPTEGDLRSLLSERSFDAAMISVAVPEKLDGCRKLLKTLKEVSTGRLRIAVGGAVLTLVSDLVALDGADVLTNDLSTAITALELAKSGSHVGL